MTDEGIARNVLPHTIVRDDYTPAMLSLVANNLLWDGSRIYHRLFGIRTNEWRVLSALGNHPGATAAEVCEVLGLHKSVVSRSTAVLRDQGLVTLKRESSAQRLYLTSRGVRLHERIMPVALEREQRLLAGFSEEEISQLRGFLLRLYENSEATGFSLESAVDDAETEAS